MNAAFFSYYYSAFLGLVPFLIGVLVKTKGLYLSLLPVELVTGFRLHNLVNFFFMNNRLISLLYSAVDQFKKQFAHLEEHYGNGGTAAPLERQQSSSLPRYHLELFLK